MQIKGRAVYHEEYLKYSDHGIEEMELISIPDLL